MIKRQLLLLAAAFTLATATSTQAQFRIPSRTYIPVRTAYPTISPFKYLGYTTAQPDMLWYFVPPGIANKVDGDDWMVFKRWEVWQTQTTSYYAGGTNTSAYRVQFSYIDGMGWRIVNSQLNMQTKAYTTTSDTGYVMNPYLWNWWDQCGEAHEYADRTFIGSDGKRMGTINEQTTSSRFQMRSLIPRALGTEIIVDFAGNNWFEPAFQNEVVNFYWALSDVIYYPPFSITWVGVIDPGPRNNTVMIYRIRTVGLTLN